MNSPRVPVGFDYVQALLQIRKHMTYEEIAGFIGYNSTGSISNILNGTIPPHPQGEAIFALYKELFSGKPPMTKDQETGDFVSADKYTL